MSDVIDPRDTGRTDAASPHEQKEREQERKQEEPRDTNEASPQEQKEREQERKLESSRTDTKATGKAAGTSAPVPAQRLVSNDSLVRTPPVQAFSPSHSTVSSQSPAVTVPFASTQLPQTPSSASVDMSPDAQNVQTSSPSQQPDQSMTPVDRSTISSSVSSSPAFDEKHVRESAWRDVMKWTEAQLKSAMEARLRGNYVCVQLAFLITQCVFECHSSSRRILLPGLRKGLADQPQNARRRSETRSELELIRYPTKTDTSLG
jgi:hypothetical protein